MASTSTRVAARDGTELLVRRWAAAAERPTATGEPAVGEASGAPWARVLLIHGLAEHGGRWEHVGARLADAGLEVMAFDQRGFGASGGRRAWVDRWSRLHDDVEDRLTELRAAGPEPVALYGHSLGGLIALGYVLDDRPQPDALVLSAPALSSAIPAWRQALAAVLNRVAPTMTVANGLDASDLSHDPAVVAAYGPDPLNVHRSTVGFGIRAFAEQERVRGALGRLRVPTLVIHGGEDRIVPTATTALLGELSGVTRRVYPGLRHEVHNEPQGLSVLDDVIGWLRATLEDGGSRAARRSGDGVG